MFEVAGRRAVVDSGADAAGDAGEHVVVELVERDPLPAVEFVTVESDSVLVGAQVAAVEQERHLVTLALMRCPVHRDEPVRGAIEAELLGDLAAAGGCGGLAALDVAARDVPGLIGGVDE